jgi:GT2 family glycosyltransferase
VEPLVWKILMRGAGTTPVIETVIINYNAGDALARCVSAVLAQSIATRVTVVDNASTDHSLDSLRRSAGDSQNLEIRVNEANLGFAKAVNAAVNQLQGAEPYLLILNPDCEVLPGSLAELAGALDQDPGAVLAGPVVVDRQGRPLKATLRRFPTPLASFLTVSGLWRLGRWIPSLQGVDHTGQMPSMTVEADAVSGACMLLRREFFLEMGGLDESYGLHCEDLDLMYRIAQCGMHCLLVPSARVFHEQGLSSKSRPGWVHWQKHLGMQRFFFKFQADQHSLPLRWLVISGIWARFCVTWPLVWFRR